MSYKDIIYYSLLLKRYVIQDFNEEDARKKFELDNEEEDIDVLYEKLKEMMLKNHPLLSKGNDEDKYKKDIKGMIKLKETFIDLGQKMVFDMYFSRKIRQLKKFKKEITGETLNIIQQGEIYLYAKSDHSELIEKLDKVSEYYQNTERYILRNYTSKEQMDYLTDIYSQSSRENIQIQKREIELNDFFETGKFANFEMDGSIMDVKNVPVSVLENMYENVSCNQLLNDPYYQHKINQSIQENPIQYNPDVSNLPIQRQTNGYLDSYFKIQDLSNVVEKKEMTYEEFMKKREEEISNHNHNQHH
jgi:hypothetical protein